MHAISCLMMVESKLGGLLCHLSSRSRWQTAHASTHSHLLDLDRHVAACRNLARNSGTTITKGGCCTLFDILSSPRSSALLSHLVFADLGRLATQIAVLPRVVEMLPRFTNLCALSFTFPKDCRIDLSQLGLAQLHVVLDELTLHGGTLARPATMAIQIKVRNFRIYTDPNCGGPGSFLHLLDPQHVQSISVLGRSFPNGEWILFASQMTGFSLPNVHTLTYRGHYAFPISLDKVRGLFPHLKRLSLPHLWAYEPPGPPGSAHWQLEVFSGNCAYLAPLRPAVWSLRELTLQMWTSYEYDLQNDCRWRAVDQCDASQLDPLHPTSSALAADAASVFVWLPGVRQLTLRVLHGQLFEAEIREHSPEVVLQMWITMLRAPPALEHVLIRWQHRDTVIHDALGAVGVGDRIRAAVPNLRRLELESISRC
ncbi:hypothetical protein C8F01DRAFT_375706 [Mycena amicta]|nr:hypothetical protein C8F01DRAFT_375706 [Mycena amicta]